MKSKIKTESVPPVNNPDKVIDNKKVKKINNPENFSKKNKKYVLGYIDFINFVCKNAGKTTIGFLDKLNLLYDRLSELDPLKENKELQRQHKQRLEILESIGGLTHIPTQTNDRYWIIYFNEKRTHDIGLKNDESGKWLIFEKPNKIDELWIKIKKFCDNYDKRIDVKCSTLYSYNNSPTRCSDDYVICVYCHKSNCMKIREKLREIGLTHKLPFKLNSTTRQNKYSFNTNERVSTYYE